MRGKGSNDVTIFGSSRYLYVSAELVACKMNVRQLQYFLILFQIVVIFVRSALLRSHNPVVPQKFFSLNRDIAIGIYEHCGIAYLERLTFPDTVSSVGMAAVFVEIWQYVRSSYGADILPTERPCISFDKVIIIIIIFVVVVVVNDFSDSDPRLRRLVFHRSGGYDDRSVCVPTF